MKMVRTFADSKGKYALYTLVCLVILIFGISKNGFSSHSWQFWMGQAFLVTAILWLLLLMISARNRFIGRTAPEFNTVLLSELEDREKSYFTFRENGFSFLTPSNNKQEINWPEIKAVNAWIEDQIVADDMLCIRIDLMNNGFLEFDEITPGFLQFLTICHQKLSCFPDGWVDRLNGMTQRKMQLFHK
jgi:hypothetical protein